jgi:hypothetical protein
VDCGIILKRILTTWDGRLWTGRWRGAISGCREYGKGSSGSVK